MIKKIALIGITVGSLFSYLTSFAQTPGEDCVNCRTENQVQESCNPAALKSTVLVQVSAIEGELRSTQKVEKEHFQNLVSAVNTLRECEKISSLDLTPCNIAEVSVETVLAPDIVRITKVGSYEASGKCRAPRGLGLQIKINRMSTNDTIAYSMGSSGWLVSDAKISCDAGTSYGRTTRNFVIGVKREDARAGVLFVDAPEPLLIPYQVVVTRKTEGEREWFEFEVRDSFIRTRDFLRAVPVGARTQTVAANSGMVTIEFTQGSSLQFNTATTVNERSGYTTHGKFIGDDEAQLRPTTNNRSGSGPEYQEVFDLSYWGYKVSQSRGKKVTFRDTSTQLNSPTIVEGKLRFEYSNGAYLDINPSNGNFAGSNFLDSSMFDDQRCETENDNRSYRYIHFTPKVRTAPNQRLTGSVITVRG